MNGLMKPFKCTQERERTIHQAEVSCCIDVELHPIMNGYAVTQDGQNPLQKTCIQKNVHTIVYYFENTMAIFRICNSIFSNMIIMYNVDVREW